MSRARAEDEEIYVIGTKNKAFLAPSSVQVISPKEMKKFHYSDPIRVLQKIPGVYLQEEDGFGLRPNIGLRGVAPHRSKKITLMEDGVLIVPAPYSSPAAYFFPNMMKISSMEVYKGISSLRYGPNSIGGAIHFITRPIPPQTQHEIGISYGDIKKYSLSTGGRKGAYGYLVETHRIESEGFKKLPKGDKDSTGFEKNDILLKGEYDFSPSSHSQKIFFKIAYANENSNETYLGITEGDFKKDPYIRYNASSRDKMKWNHEQYQLGYSVSPRGKTNIQGLVYLHQFQRNWFKLNGFKEGTHLSYYLDPSSEFFDPHFLRVLRGEKDSLLEEGEDKLVLGQNNREYFSRGFVLESSFPLKYSDSIYHHLSIKLLYHHDQIKRISYKRLLSNA